MSEGPHDLQARGQAWVDKVMDLIHEGNARHIVVRDEDGRTIMEVPVTAGVVVAVCAPVVTALGAIAALASAWSIGIEQPPPSDPIVIDVEPRATP
jgi:hypothetical protein